MTTAASDIARKVDWPRHAEGLTDALVPSYAQLLSAAWKEAAGELPMLGSFTLKNPNVQKTIKGLGTRIVGISETTRADIRGVLDRAFAREIMPGPAVIARELREHGLISSVSRSNLVARTETATAYNAGTTLSYREAGVSKVNVMDGDGDEACASVDGTTQTLEWAEENPIAHPGCVRAFSAVVD